jgi:hypothetical protein
VTLQAFPLPQQAVFCVALALPLAISVQYWNMSFKATAFVCFFHHSTSRTVFGQPMALKVLIYWSVAASIASNSQMVNGLFVLDTCTRITCPVLWQGTILVSPLMATSFAHGLPSTDTVKGLSLSEQQSCRFVILMADIFFGLPRSTCHQGLLLLSSVWVQLRLLQKPSPLPSMARLATPPFDVDD